MLSPVVAMAEAGSILDWWRLRDYQPPVAISRLAAEDTMTAYAKHVFYVNHPSLTTSVSSFRSECSESEQTIVLGCYHPDQRGIFIFNVADSRLQGVQQVTAAHEMLHAVYDRLSSKDKKSVDSMLMDYYNHDLNNQRIIDTIDAYKKSEPNDVINEMHSVFGTEIPSLPAPLENYYRRYFTNRSTITDYAQSYQSEFTSRQDQIDSLSTRMSALMSQINAEETQLSAQLDQINSDRARLDSERGSGQTAAYNSGVASFNAEVDAYNAGISRLKNDINTYNQLVNQYNAIAQELASLEKSIDTRLTPQTTQ